MRSADTEANSEGQRYSVYLEVLVCGLCGWWFVSRDSWDSSCGSVPDRAHRSVVASGAALATFSEGPDADEIRLLETETGQHLARHGKSEAWPILEDVSAAILMQFGHQVLGTGRSKDGGVDIIVDLAGHAGQAYVQVKHQKNKVQVGVLRELVGTMTRDGRTHGLIVTSSKFTRGVYSENNLFAQRGLVVELVDGQKFLSALHLTHRTAPPTLAEVTAVARPSIDVFSGEVNL